MDEQEMTKRVLDNHLQFQQSHDHRAEADRQNKDDDLMTEEHELPMVEIFETVEGEGTRAGYLTTFIRLFHCNLRCVWCDTQYSYAPQKPVFYATIDQIVKKVKYLGNPYICLTGGEPLIHGNQAVQLLLALAKLEQIKDIHIETNGAIALQPFVAARNSDILMQQKVRFIMDFKLKGSGEREKMLLENLELLEHQDEIKFVVDVS